MARHIIPVKYLLVINNGSTSLKYALFAVSGQKLFRQIKQGQINNLHSLKKLLQNYLISFIGWRVVHGGGVFNRAIKIDSNFLKTIVKFDQLAPLHNPPTIKLIKLSKKLWPRAVSVACFDTAWYQEMPATSYLYSLPKDLAAKHKIRKYGFHGLSHQSITEAAAKKLNKKLSQLSLITCQLGGGASLTWFEQGKVEDTTMGFTPNEGLTMATRSGDLPADIALYLINELKYSPQEVSKIINFRSGLLGLSGTDDLRQVLAKAAHNKSAKLALEIYIYDIARYLAAYAGMSRRLDAVVFSGAAGSNPVVRRMIIDRVNLPKSVKILFIPTEEMKNIAKQTLKCLNK